jgi:2-polyprenyl-3-methyl-5-hydroxy-6-metoxy-1,4-benzoquinol methylase
VNFTKPYIKWCHSFWKSQTLGVPRQSRGFTDFNYAWHENYPYETFLLYRYGDIRKPIFETFSERTALDFACGPGRMVRRMRRFFAKVDGCDIAQRLLDEAKLSNPDSNFYLTNGQDLGLPPLAAYDFIYCTISMQHIACHSIRTKIIRLMK